MLLYANKNVSTRKTKVNTDESTSTWKESKEENMFVLWKDWTCGENLLEEEGQHLEVKVKNLEGDVSVVHRSTDNFTFQVRTSQALLLTPHKNEWVVDFGCTHHMAKDASLVLFPG
jgi:hypothetical protein